MKRFVLSLICFLVALTLSAGAQVVPQRGVLTVFSSAARTVTTNSSDITFDFHKGVILTLDVTATSGTNQTLDVKLQGYDSVSGQYTDISGAVFQRVTTATGQRTLTVYPSPEGPGVIRSVTGTDPAANTEISETVTADRRWRLYGFAATLVTDATVANREAALVIDDGTNVLTRSPSRFNQAASLTRLYSFAPDQRIVTIATDTTQTPSMPDVLLTGGSRIRTVTTALQAGDNWSAPQMLVAEWVGNYAATPLPRIWRAVATIGGTTPSFTFSVAGTALP